MDSDDESAAVSTWHPSEDGAYGPPTASLDNYIHEERPVLGLARGDRAAAIHMLRDHMSEMMRKAAHEAWNGEPTYGLNGFS
eukprot:2117719-Alexandrium_andersonii.AAC.1